MKNHIAGILSIVMLLITALPSEGSAARSFCLGAAQQEDRIQTELQQHVSAPVRSVVAKELNRMDALLAQLDPRVKRVIFDVKNTSLDALYGAITDGYTEEDRWVSQIIAFKGITFGSYEQYTALMMEIIECMEQCLEENGVWLLSVDMRNAFDEVFRNAVVHGARDPASADVVLYWYFKGNAFIVEVIDEGTTPIVFSEKAVRENDDTFAGAFEGYRKYISRVIDKTYLDEETLMYNKPVCDPAGRPLGQAVTLIMPLNPSDLKYDNRTLLSA